MECDNGDFRRGQSLLQFGGVNTSFFLRACEAERLMTYAGDPCHVVLRPYIELHSTPSSNYYLGQLLEIRSLLAMTPNLNTADEYLIKIALTAERNAQSGS